MKRTLSLAALATSAALLTVNLGCTLSSSTGISPTSHFVYPNSNVTAASEVTGSHSSLCGVLMFSWGPPANAADIALNDALTKGSADLLMNARITSKITNFLVFSQCTTSVTGTAATMEVGKLDITGE